MCCCEHGDELLSYVKYGAIPRLGETLLAFQNTDIYAVSQTQSGMLKRTILQRTNVTTKNF